MSSEEVDLIAFITPAEGKKERGQELLSQLIEGVHKNEPDTLRYQLHYDEKNGNFVMIEKYKNQAAHSSHRESDHFKEVIKIATEEGVMGAPLDIRILKPVAGFDSR